MIHDAQVEVTCDGERCADFVYLNPPYVFTTLGGGGGHYDTADTTIENLLAREGWTVDDSKHYCEACAKANEDEAPDNEEEFPSEEELSR